MLASSRTRCSNSSSVSRAHGIGELAAVGWGSGRRRARPSPRPAAAATARRTGWPAPRTGGRRACVGPALRARTGSASEPSRAAAASSSSGMRAQRKNERRGGQIGGGHGVERARLDSGGLALHAEEEVRARQHGLQGGSDPGLEAAVARSQLVEAEQVRHLVLFEIASVRLRRQPGDDLARAGQRFGLARGAAREHPPPRAKVGHAGGVVRPAHRQAHHVRRRSRPVAGLGAGQRPVVRPDQVLVGAVHSAHEGRDQAALSGADGDRIGADREALATLEVDAAAVALEGHPLAVPPRCRRRGSARPTPT